MGCTLSFPDPGATPEASAGRITGAVVLPDGYDDALLARGHVEAQAPAEAPVLASIGADGAFELDGLAPGVYAVAARVPGFGGGVPEVTVREDEATDVGDILLRVTAEGFAVGRATRSGADRHEGIVVSAQATAAAAVTDTAGDYRLGLPPGRHVLRFDAEGYGQIEQTVDLVADADTPVGPVELTAEPGRISGSVTVPPDLPRDATLAGVEVILEREGAEPRIESAADGTFAFETVPTGAYTVRATHPDLVDTDPQAVVVGPAASVSVGALVLRRVDDRSLWGEVRGVARLEGVSEGGHGDIRVDVEGAAFTTTTNGDGAWSLPLPPLEAGYRIVARFEGYAEASWSVESLAERELVELE